MSLSPARRAHVGPGLFVNPNRSMAWRPHANLIDGELDNRTPGKVIGWMRFSRGGKPPLRVSFDLAGDFHEDIRGKVIRFSHPEPPNQSGQFDPNGTYMDGFSDVQRGEVGDITAGISLGPWTEEIARTLMAKHEHTWDELGIQGAEREKRRQENAELHRLLINEGKPFYPYVDYPYIEWYSEANGRVVLELDPSQLEILESGSVLRKKSPEELARDELKREKAMIGHLAGLVERLSEENRKNGGDGNVSGAVIG